MRFNYKSFLENNIYLDEDVFEYGTKILSRYLKFIFLTLVCSIILDSFFELILFLLFFFIVIRRYIGGLHLDNSRKCLIVSVFISLLISYSAHNIEVYDIIFFITFLILAVLIYCFAPVEHPNKKLSNIEMKMFKHLALKIVLVYLFIYLLCSYFNFKNICNTIFLVFLLCTFVLVIPVLKQKYISWRCL